MVDREPLEEQIRGHISAGNLRGAIESAVVGYGEEFVSYLIKELRNEEVAREVFSCFLQNVCSGIGTFQMESSFRTWAYVVLKNTLRRYHRERLENIPPPQLLAGPEISEIRFAVARGGTISVSMIPSSGPSATGNLRKKEEVEKLSELRQRLKKADRDLITLVVDKEMSFEEIAKKLSRRGAITAEALRQRFHRAQEKLKTMLEEDTHK